MQEPPPFPTFDLREAQPAASLNDLVASAHAQDQVFRLYKSETFENPTAQFEDLWHFPDSTPGRDGYRTGPHKSAPIHIRSMTQALVHHSSGLVFDRSGRVLLESTYAEQFRDATWAQIAPIVKEGAALARAASRQPLPAQPPIPTLYANHGGYTVFGHLMFETIPIALIFSTWLSAGRMRLLMPQAKSTAMPDRLLNQAGVPATVQVRAEAPFVWVNGLVVSSTCSGRATFAPGPMHHDFARTLMAVTPVAKLHPRRRTFLTRTGGAVTQRRDLTNEAELIDALKPLGFDVVNPSLLQDTQSMTLFANSDCLISTGGSVWADLLFAGPGTLAIELLPEQKAAVRDAFGLNLCRAKALPYIAILTKSSGASSGDLDVTADVPLIVERVQRGLERVRDLGL